MVKSKILAGILLMTAGVATFSFSKEVVKELPFEVVYEKGSYRNYVGSQILKGDLTYQFDELNGYYFEFKVDKNDWDKLPNLDTGHSRVTSFVLNGFIEMTEDELTQASKFLDMTDDLIEALTDDDFEEKVCKLTGPAIVQATNIDFDAPPDSEYFADLEALRVIETGPFSIQCQKNN